MIHPCGCQYEVHQPDGILHCVRKCPRHTAMYRDPATLDGRYYEELGVIRDGKLLPTKHVEELTEALGPLPTCDDFSDALEIGCGVSPYLPALAAAGWSYFGVDICPWACRFMANHPGAFVLVQSWDTWRPLGMFDFILCAHTLEHLRDAPSGIMGISQALRPGGEAWIVVPDDSDPSNPDHFWMFTEATLRSAIEAAGLVVERTAVRKYIKRENFIYARARKPGRESDG